MAQTCGIDPEELRVRDGEYLASEHPLETAWTFWYDKKTSDKKESDQYMEGLRQLGSFNTVEGFYRHYTHLLRPSELPRDHNCYMFRKNYKPMWEEFPEGGCWIIRIKRKASLNYVNHMWENLLLACIGEAFEMPDVVGCVLSTRLKDDVLSVWNLSNRGTPARYRIGERLKEVLDLNMTALIQYKDHMQSLQDYSTYRNARSYMFAPSPNATPMQHILGTPLQGAHDAPHDDLDGGMLPPAAIDDLLPPAAVDSEGFGGADWSSSGGVGGHRASPLLGAVRSPPTAFMKSPLMRAQAAPWHPPGTGAGENAGSRSPPLSASASPWHPPASPPKPSAVAVSVAAAAAAAAAAGGGATALAPAAAGRGGDSGGSLSWAAKAAAAARKGSPVKAAPGLGKAAMPVPPAAAAAPKRPAAPAPPKGS